MLCSSSTEKIQERSPLNLVWGAWPVCRVSVSDVLIVPSTELMDDYIKSCIPGEGSAQPPQAYSLFINN